MADADLDPRPRRGFAVPLVDPALPMFDRLNTMVWISDVDDTRVLWGNRAAIDFWGAADLASLCRHRWAMSDKARAFLHEARERLKREPLIQFETTLYNDGRPPDRVILFLSSYPLPDGRVALFVEGRPVQVTDPETLRRMDAVRYAPLVLTTHGVDGLTFSANALARSTLGEDFDFVRMFQDAARGRRLLERLGGGEAVSEDVELRTLQGKRWYALEARNMIDPVTKLPAILLAAYEITSRRDVERAKDELLSVVSHELRTPLTSIRGSIELLASGTVAEDAETRREMLMIARENARRLNRIVDDLLDVQRLVLGAVELSRARADLGEIVQGTVDLQRPAAHLADVTIEVAYDAGLVCDLDVSRIQDVLSNLLSNALKHSAAGQTITVSARRVDGRARVIVADEGPGVPAAFRHRIFRMFAQADASDRRRMGGTGLGLYIAKTLVEHHGGELGYDPHAARGARFFFDLPLAD